MVSPGAGFHNDTLYGLKKGLRGKTNWFSVRKYVMTKKRSLPTNQWVFGLKKKKMVSPGADRPPRPPRPLATPLMQQFGRTQKFSHATK